jgi:hypothetical protein
MKRISTLLLVLGILAAVQSVASAQLTDAMKNDGWISIFDGKTLDGWKMNATPGDRFGEFKVENGLIVGHGNMNHLYYMKEAFTNFELKIDCKINKGGNSGVYVKSQWQADTWPTTGFELQVNSSHGDPVKTGSLYNLIKIYKAPHNDNEWFTYHLICKGDTIDVRVNDVLLYTYVQPERARRPGGQGGQGGQGQSGQVPPITEQNKRIGQKGYIALQQHDPSSSGEFKNIFVKKLPD